MEDKTKVEGLLSHIREYVEERIRLVSLDIHDKVSRGASGIASAVVFLLFGIFILFFLSLALAWWLGGMLEDPFLGFLIVGGLYLVSGIVIYINRAKWIRFPVINALLKNIADEED